MKFNKCIFVFLLLHILKVATLFQNFFETMFHLNSLIVPTNPYHVNCWKHAQITEQSILHNFSFPDFFGDARHTFESGMGRPSFDIKEL